MSHARPPKDVPHLEAGEQGLTAGELRELELQNRVRALEQQREQLRGLVEAFAAEVEAGRAHLQRKKGGQQVTPTGDFVYAQPSVLGRLAWWAREFQARLVDR